jgi:hypothetical protein
MAGWLQAMPPRALATDFRRDAHDKQFSISAQVEITAWHTSFTMCREGRCALSGLADDAGRGDNHNPLHGGVSATEIQVTKRVLMVTFHFPPLAGSSGIQRTLRFVQHLPSLGWEPIVLTASPRAYEATSEELLREIPEGIHVERAFALDTARHLSVFKRYPALMARPDRWRTWKWGAVSAGLRLIRSLRPQAIWSTFPTATAHSIAATLQRRTGLPWIADFRDPMAQADYPPDPATWRSYKAIEEETVQRAARCVFVAPGAANLYRIRYPEIPAEHMLVIENGFDEESFAGAEFSRASAPLVPGKLTLVHSGIVYPVERDPTQLMEALARMRKRGDIDASRLCVRFRAPVHEKLLRCLSEERSIGDLVQVEPAVPYREALREMLNADGLVLMQASNCNEQVPAKFYEYLRARRPILGLTDPAGDTARAMRAAGAVNIAPLDDSEAIERALRKFLADLASGSAAIPPDAAVRRASRRSRSEELARVLDEVVVTGAPHRSSAQGTPLPDALRSIRD